MICQIQKKANYFQVTEKKKAKKILTIRNYLVPNKLKFTISDI